MKRQRIRLIIIFISFLLFPITIYYLSPYLIIVAASQRIISGSFILFSILFLSSLFLGRGFCGWFCPVGGFQESCFHINSKQVQKGDWIKYLIWIPWLVIIIFITLSVKGFRQVDPMYITNHGISVAEPRDYIIYYVVIALVTTLALIVGKRSFCHHVCWGAPFMIIGTKIQQIFKWPALHLESKPEKCNHCKICTKACPMSLEVEAMVAKADLKNAECILCGSCVDACPNKVIQYQFISVSKISKVQDVKIDG